MRRHATKLAGLAGTWSAPALGHHTRDHLVLQEPPEAVAARARPGEAWPAWPLWGAVAVALLAGLVRWRHRRHGRAERAGARQRRGRARR